MLCVHEKLYDIDQTYHACQFYYRYCLIFDARFMREMRK